MPRAFWSVELDSETHIIELDWTFLGGLRRIIVDGQMVSSQPHLLRFWSDQQFEVGGKAASLVIRPRSIFFKPLGLELQISGKVYQPELVE